MADADGGVDAVGVHAGQCPAARAARHRCFHVTGSAGATIGAHGRSPAPAGRARARAPGARRRCSSGCAAARARCCSSRASRASASPGCSRSSRRSRTAARSWPLARPSTRPTCRTRSGSEALTAARPRRSAGARRRPRGRAPRAARGAGGPGGRRSARPSASTTCTGPIPDRPRRSPRSSTGRPPDPCCSPSPPGRAGSRSRSTAALGGFGRDAARARTARPGGGARARRRRRRRRVRGQRRESVLPEQLARPHGPGAAADAEGTGACRRPWRPSLAAELAGSRNRRPRLLDGAAIAGDPFEIGLAAEVAELASARASTALDVLLGHGLVKPGGAPRRFAFRHPVVRHARPRGGPGRLADRRARPRGAALERRGAGPVERAHHVEQSAAPGDERAIAVLDAAAHDLQSLAPSTAARFLAALVRLLPAGAGATGARLRLADAQAAAGDRGRRARDAARRARRRAGSRPAADHDRRRQRGVAAGPHRTTPGGGSTSRSEPCPPSRRPTASACGSRSR